MTRLLDDAATDRADNIKVKLDEVLEQLETAHPRHLPLIEVVPDKPYTRFAVADTGEHEVLGALRVGDEAGLPRMKRFSAGQGSLEMQGRLLPHLPTPVGGR